MKNAYTLSVFNLKKYTYMRIILNIILELINIETPIKTTPNSIIIEVNLHLWTIKEKKNCHIDNLFLFINSAITTRIFHELIEK